jgi:hypothetical protein
MTMGCCRRLVRVGSTILALGLTLGPLRVPARAADQGSPSALKVIGEKTVVVNPICDAFTGAKLNLILQNNGKQTVPLSLRLERLIADAGSTAINVRIGLGANKEGDTLPSAIPPGGIQEFAITVRGSLGAGNWKGEIFNGETDLGPVNFIVPDIPLHLKPDTTDPNQPTIVLTRGESSTLLLKNDDAVGYEVAWNMRLSSQPEKLLVSLLSGKGKVPAGGSIPIEIEPTKDWFKQGWFHALFKDEEAEALLTVRLCSDLCTASRPSDLCTEDAGAPMKVFRVKTTLAYYSTSIKDFGSYLTLVVLLFLGAICSLALNYIFPDQQIRRDLQAQLLDIKNTIEGLSMRLASRLRVMVGVQRLILKQQLESLRWYQTNFETRRAAIADDITRLKRRVEILNRIGRSRDEYERAMALDAPPSILDRIGDLFDKIGDALEVPQVADTDLQDTELKLAEIDKALSGWSQADALLAAQIASSLGSLYGDLQADGALAQSATFGALKSQFTILVRDLVAKPPGSPAIPTNEYYRWDRVSFRGNTLRAYALLCDEQNPGADSPLITRRGELIKLLKTESWDALRRARRLVWEMSNSIYASDIRTAIEAKQVEIQVDRNEIRPFEPAQFYLRFQTQRLNSAAAREAREEWFCTWNFGHGPFRGTEDDSQNFLEEDGWSVAHYFPVSEHYSLNVRFRHEEDGELKDAQGNPASVKREIFVGPVDDLPEIRGRWEWARKAKMKWRNFRNWSRTNGNEVASLSLALVPAVLALVSGAKDQLLKMDLFPALCAVFLAGFGSDQIKNLLSSKSKS